MKNYVLMKKNQPVAACQFDDVGNMIRYQVLPDAMDLAPLGYRKDPAWLKKWWSDRSVPVHQSGIKKILSAHGYITSEQYLFKNLGLSLTDYYWIRPIDSDLTWKKINLFDNPFHENILLEKHIVSNDDIPHYSPNSSLQGGIEKTWTIIDGQRCMIKGNHSISSAESINEVFASEIHKQQGYDNYLPYRLIKIKNKPYKYGCVSNLITSQKYEMISAHALVSSEKKPNNISIYDFLLNVCEKYGADREKICAALEYQIMTDFIITNYDRHLNNISFLRDADTLKLVGMAPIYDSGSSLFAEKQFPANIKELEKVEINSFHPTELKLLGLVKNKNCINLTKLPSVNILKSLYEKDDYCDSKRLNGVLKWYERKIDICRNIQLNKDPKPTSFAVLAVQKDQDKKEIDEDKITDQILGIIDFYKNTDHATDVEEKISTLVQYCDEVGVDDLTDRFMKLDEDGILPDFVYDCLYEKPYEYNDD